MITLKKRKRILLTLWLSLASSLHASFTELYNDLRDPHSNSPIIVAHRGDWRSHPENSIPAFQSCIANGVHALEVDVRITSDGVPIIMHDSTVDRTTNGIGKVSSMTLAQIKKLRLKTNKGGSRSTLTDEQVPTLEEVMLLAKDHCFVYLDKTYPKIISASMTVVNATHTLPNALWRATGNAQTAKNAYTSLAAKYPDIEYNDFNIVFKVSCSGTTSPTMATIMSQLAIVDPVILQVNYTNSKHPIFSSENISAIRHSGRGTRVLVNTMHDGRIHKDPNVEKEPKGWDWVLDHRITTIETDRPLWLTPFVQSKIFNHQPQDSSVSVPANQTLKWMRGYGAISHDVYFSSDHTSLSQAKHTSPEFKGNQTELHYQPEAPLDSLATYYWRIDEVTASGTIKGDVMKFKTMPAIPAD